MKHLATINNEFAKKAVKWRDLSYETQKDYLSKHPKSERRLTSIPQDVHGWAKSRKFINLQTNQPSNFEDLPQEQQEALKANFEKEKARLLHLQTLPQEKTHKRSRYIIQQGDNSSYVKAKDTEDAIVQFLLKHEYSQSEAERFVKSLNGNYSDFKITKVTKRKLTDRKVNRLAKHVAKELKDRGTYSDSAAFDIAKVTIERSPELQSYFKEKGFDDNSKAAEAFSKLILSPKKRKFTVMGSTAGDGGVVFADSPEEAVARFFASEFTPSSSPDYNKEVAKILSSDEFKRFKQTEDGWQIGDYEIKEISNKKPNKGDIKDRQERYSVKLWKAQDALKNAENDEAKEKAQKKIEKYKRRLERLTRLSNKETQKTEE